jgi:hypothetical protein
MKYYETRLYKFAKECRKIAQKAVPAYSSKFSKKIFTQDQHIAIGCIKVKTKQKLRDNEEMMSNMPHLCEAIGLAKVPDFTTTCKAIKRLKNKVFAVLLYLSASVMPSNGNMSIDATGFDRRHCRKHDTKIVLPAVESTRSGFAIKTLCGDKGYDDKAVRDSLRSMGIRPLIPHREFKPVDKAHNARMNAKTGTGGS